MVLSSGFLPVRRLLAAFAIQLHGLWSAIWLLLSKPGILIHLAI